MPNKIIDCFIFYNEMDMLKYRLDYLYDTVDKIILLESTLTFSGVFKELYFQNNKHLYQKYMDKIIHVVVDDLPGDSPNKTATENAWIREKLQRNLLDRGISQLDLNDNDIIVITDLDEIPDINTLNILKNTPKIDNVAIALEQDMYYYNLTCKGKSKWYHPKLVNFYTYKTIFNRSSEDIRTANRYAIIKNGGWHFSYFGDIKFIQNKIKSFSHQEYNNEKYTNESNIIKQVQTCGDLFLRDNEHTHHFTYCKIEENTYLPHTYTDLLKYSDCIIKKDK